MRILGLDTATWRASVGVWCDGAVVAESVAPTRGNHAAILLPLIEEALRNARCGLRDLDVVAVSSGPGSFTGLRVGVSVAKGLGLATGLAVVAVSTLEALARTGADREGMICAALDAHKGEVYAALFESRHGGWTRVSADALLTLEALLPQLPIPCLVVGSAVEPYGEELRNRLGHEVTLLGADAHRPCGGTVAALGWERWQSTGPADLASLEPFYVRPPDAVVHSR